MACTPIDPNSALKCLYIQKCCFTETFREPAEDDKTNNGLWFHLHFQKTSYKPAKDRWSTVTYSYNTNKWEAETWACQGRESTCCNIRSRGIKSKEVNFPPYHPYTWITFFYCWTMEEMAWSCSGRVALFNTNCSRIIHKKIRYHTESGICFSSCHTSPAREQSELQKRPKGTIFCTIITRRRGCQVGIWVKFIEQLALEQCFYF